MRTVTDEALEVYVGWEEECYLFDDKLKTSVEVRTLM